MADPIPTLKSSWYSPRVRRTVNVKRWGHAGQPVLIFPTAGGDFEECERFLMMRVLDDLLRAGRIRVYSCDSVGGQAMMDGSLTPAQAMSMQNGFHQWLRHELVPAIRIDSGGDWDIWAAGSSIGAFHAAAVVCRFPDVFSKALSMSGTYDLLRFFKGPATDEYRISNPLHFVPHLGGRHLEILRTRYLHICTGSGRHENVGESWQLAQCLGAKGIPNFMDDWGPDWHHDWITWREMAPKILAQWTAR